MDEADSYLSESFSESDDLCSDPNLLRQMHRICQDLHRLCKYISQQVGISKEDFRHLKFSVHWTVGSNPQDLLEELIHTAQKSLSVDISFRTGAVYCYACNSNTCIHATPPHPGSVFAGYSFSGEAQWEELFNFLNILEDERIEDLFTTRPLVLARIIPRSFLIAKQGLGGGRESMTYRILGEIVCGYFYVQDQRYALTIQVVENISHQLHVQLIAQDMLLSSLVESEQPSQILARVYQGIRVFQQWIQKFNPSWKRIRGERRRYLYQDLFSQFRHLANLIERKSEQHHRRTDHALWRQSQSRPIHAAFRDLQEASIESFFFDRYRHSIVVIGKSSRVHVFSESGKHITSFLLSHGQIERRIQRKRYIPLPPDKVNGLKSVIGIQPNLPSSSSIDSSSNRTGGGT